MPSLLVYAGLFTVANSAWELSRKVQQRRWEVACFVSTASTRWSPSGEFHHGANMLWYLPFIYTIACIFPLRRNRLVPHVNLYACYPAHLLFYVQSMWYLCLSVHTSQIVFPTDMEIPKPRTFVCKHPCIMYIYTRTEPTLRTLGSALCSTSSHSRKFRIGRIAQTVLRPPEHRRRC